MFFSRTASWRSVPRCGPYRLLPMLWLAAALATVSLAQDPLIPKNGCGITWRTLAQARGKVRLSNGQDATYPITWTAFPELRDVTFVGYDVKLSKAVTVKINGQDVTKDTIRVWVLPKDKSPARTQQEWDNYTYWCHGLTFDDNIYSPGGEEVPFILAAGYRPLKDCNNLQQGDVIVFRDAGGNVVHTAVSNGNGTFSTKNREEAPIANATLAQLQAKYGQTIDCHRCVK